MTGSADSTASSWRLLATPVGLMVVGLAAMWGIEALDSVALDDALQRNGLRPREREGLDGILWAPFLHSDFGHVASNSVPFLALGGLVAVRGRRYWGWVTASSILVGGGLTWLVAGSGNHIGVSGVVFGYFGAILGAAVFERHVRALGAALIALGFYSSLIAGLVPQDAVSWEGHLFGLLAGVIMARVLAEPRPASLDDSHEPEPWELDEPWTSN
ncbi:MAG: rhomboid family intramembrane serine protease [Candidatus Nanopelagicales bacterium]